MTAYGAAKVEPTYIRQKTDPRYGSSKWRRVRLIVLDRDRHCYVISCPERANIADHINPVYQGMPDREFYALTNLRASCKRHNTARGVAARLQREIEGGVAPEPSRYSFGKAAFLRRVGANDAPLANLSPSKRTTVVTADYSRREVKRVGG
jgi:hypothetical protein